MQNNVGCAGRNQKSGNVDKSGLQAENSKTGGPSLSVNDASLKKTASFENRQVQSILTSNVSKIRDSPSDLGEQLQTGLHRNDVENQSSNENESLGEDLVVIGTPRHCAISTIDISDCDIIPDTPEFSLPTRTSSRTFGRSFLSSASSVSFVSLENENGLPKKKLSNPKKQLQKRGRSFESRLKSKSPFSSSDRDLDHTGKCLTASVVTGSRSPLSHSNTGSEFRNISPPFFNNSEENEKLKRSSGELSPTPKRRNHRRTPERISEAVETTSDQDQVTKRLTYQNTLQDTDTETASNTVTMKTTLSSSRLCYDNTVSGSLSKQKQSQKAVVHSPNLDNDENLSAILIELKANISPSSSTPSKPLSYHRKKQPVGQSRSEEVRIKCTNQSSFLDKLCADDVPMATEIVSPRNDVEEISQQQIIQTDDKGIEHTNLDEDNQIYLQNTQFIAEDFSQEKDQQLDISEIISQQEVMSEEGVTNLVPSSPSLADNKDSQSSGGSSGHLCRQFEKMSPFKISDSNQ